MELPPATASTSITIPAGNCVVLILSLSGADELTPLTGIIIAIPADTPGPGGTGSLIASAGVTGIIPASEALVNVVFAGISNISKVLLRSRISIELMSLHAARAAALPAETVNCTCVSRCLKTRFKAGEFLLPPTSSETSVDRESYGVARAFARRGSIPDNVDICIGFRWVILCGIEIGRAVRGKIDTLIERNYLVSRRVKRRVIPRG